MLLELICLEFICCHRRGPTAPSCGGHNLPSQLSVSSAWHPLLAFSPHRYMHNYSLTRCPPTPTLFGTGPAARRCLSGFADLLAAVTAQLAPLDAQLARGLFTGSTDPEPGPFSMPMATLPPVLGPEKAHSSLWLQPLPSQRSLSKALPQARTPRPPGTAFTSAALPVPTGSPDPPAACLVCPLRPFLPPVAIYLSVPHKMRRSPRQSTRHVMEIIRQLG